MPVLYTSASPGTSSWSELGDIPSTPSIVADPGDGNAIPITGGKVYFDVGAGVETNTLADPTADGIFLLMSMRTDGGGSRAVTAAHVIDGSSNTVMTFDSGGETIILRSTQCGDGSGGYLYRWLVWLNFGTTLS